MNAARDGERGGAAMAALGALGAVEAVTLLLNAMRHEPTAPAAAAAFARICGAEEIDADRPEPGLETEEEVDDEEILDEPEPLPDPEKAEAWWQSNQGRFTPEGRWQAGLDVGETPMQEIELVIPLLVRRDLHLGLWAASPDEARDVELEARVVVQMEPPSTKRASEQERDR
jgi:hypothetical protein